MSELQFVDIPTSPLVPGMAPVSIRYRDTGRGQPVVLLHGGWGYEIYPFDRQIAALSAEHRVVIPDRSGYGGSPPIDGLPEDFHRRAADETRAVLDRLGLVRPILWGHSDGAIVALLLGLADRGRVAGAIVEATHFYKDKPASRAFFEAIAANPESLGPRASAVLAGEHGERWRRIVALHSRAWRQIAAGARSAAEDFYDGRLSDLRIPVLLLHGAKDPRTEPGELDALRAALQSPPSPRLRPASEQTIRTPGTVHAPVHREFAVFEEAGHSPHSERETADAVTAAAVSFVARVASRRPARSADPTHSADRARRDPGRS
jgi:pimeloyl-ACP methyl ester carboxylesterase